MSTWSLRFWERCRVIEVFAFFTDSSVRNGDCLRNALGRYVSPAKTRRGTRQKLDSSAATVSVTKNVFRVRESRFPSGPVEFFCAKGRESR